MVSIPMHFGLIIDPSPCLLGLGGRAWEWGGSWQCQVLSQSPVLAGATAQEGFFTAEGSGTRFACVWVCLE